MKDAILAGQQGEDQVSLLLSTRRISYVNDIKLKTNTREGKTQIDFVVVHNTGVFCLEVKNYNNCIIKGNTSSKTWTVNYYGKYESLYNPIYQNLNHISELKHSIEGIERTYYINNIVLFNKEAELSIEGNKYENIVYRYGDLINLITSREYILTDKQVESYLNQIRKLKEKGDLLDFI